MNRSAFSAALGHPLAKRGAVAVGVGILAVQWVITMVHPRGDFVRHCEFGRRFLAGEFLYTGGLDVPYPPLWAMLHAPFAALPPGVAMPLFFLVGVAGLIALLMIFRSFSRRIFRAEAGTEFWSAAAALFLASRFLLRDFSDGGPNLALLALAWGGVYFWLAKRPLAAGASLGLAVALKCTAALFIAYWLWKRQWKTAGAAIGFAILFSVLPALRMGPAQLTAHLQTWGATVWNGVAQDDPSIGVLGPEPLQNKSLRPALARFLLRLPDGHSGRFAGRGHVDFLSLTPATAALAIRCVLALFALLLAWRFWPREIETDRKLVWECAVVSLAMPLLSPIAWGQHFVAALPALYFVCRSISVEARCPRGALATLGAIAFVMLATNRTFLGRSLSLLLESYHLITFAMFGLLLLALAFHARAVERAT